MAPSASGSNEAQAEPGTHAASRVLVIATDDLTGAEVIEDLRRHLREAGASEVMVIFPAVETTAFRHALGDVDTATQEAKRRLEASLLELRAAGIPALAEVGDSDPLVAAKDSLLRYPAEEVLIVAHADDQARWFEEGLFERAQEALYPALRLVTVRRDGDGPPRLAGIAEAGPGRRASDGRELELSPNLPRFSPGDLAGILIAIVGTIAVIVIAATGPGVESTGGAAQILIAIGVALVNMAHAVGIVLFESVHYRGGWQRFFRNLSLTATPLAIVVSALITILD